jgi:predicted ATPase
VKEAPAEAPPASAHYTLVGRATEWQTLLAAYAGVYPDGRLIVLEGEAGIGKTRLAETFWQHMRTQGGRVLVARCYEGETNLAYGPFVEGLRAVIAAHTDSAWAARLAPHWLAEAARLLPEVLPHPSEAPITPTGSATENPGAQSRFFEGLRQVLLAALRPNRDAGPAGLIVIDDAHWLDEASLDLLTYLVRRWRGQPLALLLTWRPEQVPAGHRLRQLLAEALRASAGQALSLGRLSRAAVAELVAQAATGQPDLQGLVQRLYDETEGLPFFVVEYLHTLPAAGDGNPSTDWSLPGSVRTILQTRLARVDDTGWQLLTAAAIIGRSFDFDTLQSASGRADEETVVGLEALMAAGLVNELNGHGQSPTYDFSHEKLRALVVEETSLARRRLLHRRVAEALLARARRTGALPAAANQIADHFLQAGREAEAAEHYLIAGEHARGLFANAEALAHFRSALALGHPAAATLHEAIGDLLTLSGLYESALTSYERAAALAGDASIPGAPSLAALEHKLGGLYHRLGDWDLAESQFQSALSAWGEAAAGERARLYADWSLTAHHRGDTSRALQLANQALSLAETGADPRALAQAHNILGILAGSQGQHAEARRHLEQSLTLAESQGDPSSRVAALNNLALAYGQQGQHPAAIVLVEQALALARSQGDRHREAALHSNLADLLHASGQAEAADRHVKQSVTLYAEIGAEAGALQLQPEIWKLAEW